MKQHKRLFAWIVCIGMILVLFVSSAYIAHEAEHDCTGEDCEICENIAQMEALLQNFALLGVILLAFYALVSLARTSHIAQSAYSYAVPTLVGWKVRLNN